MPSEMRREMFFGKLIDKGEYIAHAWNKKDKRAIAIKRFTMGRLKIGYYQLEKMCFSKLEMAKQ